MLQEMPYTLQKTRVFLTEHIPVEPRLSASLLELSLDREDLHNVCYLMLNNPMG